MKKFLSFLFILILAFCCETSSNAAANETCTPQTTIEYTSTGGFYITELKINQNIARSIVSYNKSILYKNSSGESVWKFTLTGEFTYNGTTATCQTTSNSVEVYDSDWVVMSRQSYPSGNQAIGIIKIKEAGQLPMEKVLTLTCSPNGTVQ